jgi:hypothetical protein
MCSGSCSHSKLGVEVQVQVQVQGTATQDDVSKMIGTGSGPTEGTLSKIINHPTLPIK